MATMSTMPINYDYEAAGQPGTGIDRSYYC